MYNIDKFSSPVVIPWEIERKIKDFHCLRMAEVGKVSNLNRNNEIELPIKVTNPPTIMIKTGNWKPF